MDPPDIDHQVKHEQWEYDQDENGDVADPPLLGLPALSPTEPYVPNEDAHPDSPHPFPSTEEFMALLGADQADISDASVTSENTDDLRHSLHNAVQLNQTESNNSGCKERARCCYPS